MPSFHHYSHLPDGRVKSFEIDFMSKYYAEIYDKMKVSRFRHPKNVIPSLLYIDAMKYTGYGILDSRVYKNSCYAEITARMNYKIYENKEMVCFNDTANSNRDFVQAQKNLVAFLESKFPEKSQFEK